MTELELTAAALVGINGLTYFFWWDKPVALRRPFVLRTRAVEKVVFAGGGAKEEGEVEARYEEMEMEYIWDSHSEETDEETEFRIKVSWKSCVLDASGSVYCPLITIPGYLFQVVFQGLQGTFSSIHSVLRAPYEGVCNPKTCFQFLVPASTPATPAPLFSLALYSAL